MSQINEASSEKVERVFVNLCESEIAKSSENEKPSQKWTWEVVDACSVPEFYVRPPIRKVIRNGRVYYEGLEPRTLRLPNRISSPKCSKESPRKKSIKKCNLQ